MMQPLSHKRKSLDWPALALLLALLWPLNHAEGRQAGAAPPARAGADEPLKDSLTERGSHNFSDMGSWIWETNTFDRQTVRFWNEFQIPPGATVQCARLRITADNEYILYLDGRELGRDAEWRHIYEYDVTPLLKPGHHVLGVEAYNSSREAGFLFGLRIGLNSGKAIGVKSDTNWFIVPENAAAWQKKSEPGDSWHKAIVMSGIDTGPWGKPDFIDLVPPMEPVLVRFWQTAWFEVLLACVCGIFTLVSLGLTMQLLLHHKERQLLLRERARIARDIHDDLGTRVTRLVLQGEVAQSDLPSGSVTHAKLQRISDEAREALTAMDEILWAINPRRDNLQEFATFVCSQAKNLLMATSIECLLDVEPAISAVAFDLPFRRSLLMAVKEAINNAAKHSRATEVHLQIHRKGQGLVVAVVDNGQGFDPSRERKGRNGMENMRERLREVGGTCSVTSQPGKGCRVEFYIPSTQMRRRVSWLRFKFRKSF